ncbi:MAG: RNA polymerase sigma-70 factor [Bacteroidota bacterium]|nr:RNA polymerase sigma-70 factor [Bacteroidota bacterium]MDP4211373.1 RNA polymerase sigma-70 factor [Bacteroidota bacterium]MDP4251970.1 RNA polymerase sigma-70 factor [Bacteroidota bacterium]
MEIYNPFSDPSRYAGLQQEIAAGNETAFKQLYGYFYKRLFHFALSMVKIKEAAEEIIEDVYIRIWQQRENITAIQNLKVYLYTAVKNTSLNYLSKKAKENITEPFDHIHIEFSEPVNPEQLMITAEMFNKIQHAVEALPPRCKMIFKLIREDGLKYKEVSQILNISVNTIDAQMAIAVSRIATALAADFGPMTRKHPLAG